MKHKHLKHLFTTLLLMMCSTIATAHDFEVGGIYYNILSEEEKTVEVTYKGTYSSQYSNEYTGSVVIPSTVVKSSGITFDAWTSTNKSDGSTSQTSYTLNVQAGNVLKFDWSVSSESNYDWLIITLDGTEIIKQSGIQSGSYEKVFDAAGSHTLVVKYIKDSSQSRNNDEGKIYNVTLNDAVGVEEVEYRVTSIDGYAFSGCTGLTSIEIPNSVTSIGNSAFRKCSGLTNVVIGNSVASIGWGAFEYCTGLTSITIPNSVRSIGSEAFRKCSGLTSIEILNSVTSIGESAFTGCDGLTSIEIPNSVTSIGSQAFRDCTRLTSVVIGNSVRSIELGMFYDCTGLTTIVIPNSVTNIDDYAFCGCSSLTSIMFPNSVTTIGNGVFIGCSSLSNITVAAGNTKYDSRDNCNAIIETATSTLVLGCNGTIIPNSVTSIGDYAFCGCTGLTSIVIPNSVTSIGNYAFEECSALTDLCIEDGEEILYLGICEYFVDGDNHFAVSMFNDCPLKTLYIGRNWDYAESELYNSYTAPFNHKLTSVTIGNNVTSFKNFEFFSCTGITSVTSLIPADELFAINSYVFNYVDKTSCTLYVPYGAKETYAATEGWSEFENIVELEKPITEVNIIINQYGNATYCSEYALDFSEVEGLKAYAATGYKSNSQVVTLTRVQTAEAGVGLFLKGEPGEYVVPVIESTDEHSLNLLVGTLEQTVVNSTDGAMSNYKFTILPGDETPMFYPFEDNTTLSAGKAYLQIPTAWLPATAQKSLSVRFDDGETTDIDELKGEDGKVKGICYDLSGRVVENPTSGIYIINGKKVVVK